MSENDGITEIEKAKLAVYKEIRGMLSDAVEPLFKESKAFRDEANVFRESIAVTTERLRAGAETFDVQRQRIDGCEDRVDELESWRDVHDGRTAGYEEAARDAGEKSGRFWGAVYGLIALAINAVVAFLSFRQ